MWDNAALLRSIANALFALSGLAILYGAIYYTVHLPNLFPLRDVHLNAAPQRVAVGDVLQVVRSEVRGNFFTVDIGRVRRSVERLPWVRNVVIRREFPGRLVMQVEEHHALARWNGSALVNQQGEVFMANSEQVLPSFIGPESAASEVAQQYGQFSRQLAPLNLQVAQLVLSARHAWRVRLSNDVVLELGRNDVGQRMQRFVSVYPYSLATMQDGARYVDLRYPKGFAVGGVVRS